MPTGSEVAIAIGIWAMGLLIITVLYKIFISVRQEVDSAKPRRASDTAGSAGSMSCEKISGNAAYRSFRQIDERESSERLPKVSLS